MSTATIQHTMTEEEQATVWKEIKPLSQPLGPQSAALIAKTEEFTVMARGSIMLVLPEYLAITATARKNSDGDGYYVSSFEYDASYQDLFDEINMQVFRQRLARFVMQEGEDIFLGANELDWRE